MLNAELVVGDCLEVLPRLASGCARLAYLDPPFFTQSVQRLSPRDGSRPYSYSDLWLGHDEYADFIGQRLAEVRRVLSPDGTVVFHCDRRCCHIARALLDRVFGAGRFRSEIIWHYRRWSNAKKALLPAHQTLYLYSKGDSHVFNPIRVQYSPATNVDQILQRRVRDARGKSAYERDAAGGVVLGQSKQGVPLSDVWDIPYLNPKAKERVGYPTQKPILLLERVVSLLTHPGDTVVDPFCGSGTALVAAQLLGRKGVGIDRCPRAVELSRRRLAEPVKTESQVVTRGRASYAQVCSDVLAALGDLKAVPVQRNRGIDAIASRQGFEGPVAVRVQRSDESIEIAVDLLARAGRALGCQQMVIVVTEPGSTAPRAGYPPGVVAIETQRVQLERLSAVLPGRQRPRLRG
jgi:site-specific DNA-methyltransferase (adenine-specific)